MSALKKQDIMMCVTCGNNLYNNFIKLDDGHVCKCCGVWYKKSAAQSEIRQEMQCEIGFSKLKNYEFDAAKDTFRRIVTEYPENANALWGLLLARYGVVMINGFFDDTAEPVYCFPEYEDNGGQKFRNEPEYKKLMEILDKQGADLKLKYLYESKAKEIDDAIAKFLESKKNTDIDVFICVKISAATEADPARSGRTQDYDYAVKVYNELNRRGLKVFFSFVTLENDINSDDIIWVNLVKSKKMLLVGSTEEYLESVWVKSEWKRWLYLGREKDLYICSMKHENEYPKAILPHELTALRPQIYTLDTYDKMIEELCGRRLPAKPANASKATTEVNNCDGKIIYKDGREEIIPYGIEEIAEKAYFENKEIVSVVLPGSVKRIGKGAFCACAELETVVMPDSILEMHNHAFSECEKLKNVTISKNIEIIPYCAFYNCFELKSISIPSGIKMIDSYAFAIYRPDIYSPNANALRSSLVYCGLSEPQEAPLFKGLSGEIIIPEGVQIIKSYAFDNCTELKSAKLPKSLKELYGFPGDIDIYYNGKSKDWCLVEGHLHVNSKVHFKTLFGYTKSYNKQGVTYYD